MSIFDGKHFYNQTLKKSVAVFGTIFNNIKISQFQKGEVRVPIAYGPRKKFLAKIQADTERDNFMQAEEAKKYGLIDNILTSRD